MNILFFIILFILLLSLKCNNNFEFYDDYDKKRDMKNKLKKELNKKYPHTAKFVKNISNITSELYQYYSNIKFDKKCINKNLNKSKNKLNIQDFLNLTTNC